MLYLVIEKFDGRLSNVSCIEARDTAEARWNYWRRENPDLDKSTFNYEEMFISAFPIKSLYDTWNYWDYN